MAQVLLINPPYCFAKDGSYLPNKEVWKPLGILYLAAELENKGISTEILDLMPQEKKLKEVTNIIEKKSTKIVGITGTTPQIRGIIQLGEAIKKQFGSKVFLAAGGPHVSCDPKFANAFPFFDLVFVGEGEVTFPRVVRNVLEGKQVGKIVYGESPSNLDNLPYPARALLKDRDYSQGPHGASYITIHTTRGCPFRCIYCSSPVERRAGVRFRTPESVVDEIDFCTKEFGTKFVIFTDDTFTLSQKRVEGICRILLKRHLKIKWNCETRASMVDKNLLNLMRKAGCVEIFFGVESGSERIRNEIINKRVDDSDLYKAFDTCRNLGITTNAFLMAGFPTETKKELRETWDFCFKAKPDIIGLHLTVVLPGAPIFNFAVEEGKIKPDVWHRYARGEIHDQPVYVPEGLTLKDLEIFQKNLYRKFYFRPRWLLRRLKTSLCSWNQFKSDLKVAWQLLSRGKSKARSYREEDYFQ